MLVFFFFNDTATTEIYTLSLHDALPISPRVVQQHQREQPERLLLVRHQQAQHAGEPDRLGAQLAADERLSRRRRVADRKSTRLNSSHANISYAVFCLKKKKH